MSVRIMHLADLHLGASLSYLGGRASERAHDLESAFVRALELAPEKNVHAVVIAGDLFDSFNPPPELVATVKAAFGKTTESGIPIILIPGTHDSHRYARCVWTRAEFKGVDILFDAGERLRKNINGDDVYFYGYSGGRKGRDSIDFRRDEEEGIHIALVHGSVKEGTHWPDSPRDFSLSPDEIERSHFDYIALGHHHNFREFRYGKSLAVYPGTLEGMKFGEENDRHLIIADIDENGVTLEKIEHNKKTLSEIQIDLALAGIESTDSLLNEIRQHADPNVIMKIVLTGTTDFLPAEGEIETLLSDQFFYLTVSDATTVFDSEMVRSIVNEDTVLGIFTRAMLDLIEKSPDEKREVAELALRLGIEQFMRLRDENN